MKQEIGAPSGEHSSCFDTAFGFAGAHEVKSEAADDGHVLGAVALSIAGEIVLELQVENPVHGLNAPVTADRRGDAVDLKGERDDIDTGLAMALTGLLGSSVNLNQGFDGRKAGPPGYLRSEAIQSAFAEALYWRVSMRPWPFSRVVVETISSAGALRK